MLCSIKFSYKILFDELRSIDSVVEGTDKLRKAFVHCISADGKVKHTSEDVRGIELCLFLINNVINIFVINQQFKESLKQAKVSIHVTIGSLNTF